MAEQAVATEVAEKDFERFVEAMDLDLDPADMDANDQKDFQQDRGRVIKAICSGSLVVTDDGEPIFTPQRSAQTEPITFYEPTGATLMAMDRKKKTQDIGKMYAVMADMTKTNAAVFSKLKMSDLKVCLAVTTLFLA